MKCMSNNPCSAWSMQQAVLRFYLTPFAYFLVHLQIFTKRLKKGVWDIRAIVDSGGMPSSHSALCAVSGCQRGAGWCQGMAGGQATCVMGTMLGCPQGSHVLQNRRTEFRQEGRLAYEDSSI